MILNTDFHVFQEFEKILSTNNDIDARDEARQIIDFVTLNGFFDRSKGMEIINKRLNGVPLAQMINRTNFMGLDLYFENGVFVVRSETELLGWSAVKRLRSILNDMPERKELKLVDIGCGSGNLTCGIANEIMKLKVFAVDVLETCISLTSKNVERHGLNSRVSIFKGDLFEPLQTCGLDNSVDIIVSNPPYISTSRLKGDRAYLISHEPIEAFDGGPFGISMVQRLIKESIQYLKPGGFLLFEFGLGQDKQIQKLFERAGGYDLIEFEANSAGEKRVAVARKGISI